MKKWFVLILLLSCSLFAQREITRFSTDEIGEVDDFIRPEFGDELKAVQPGMVKDGLFYLRQKFEDPFDDTQVNYQIFQGIATDASVNLIKFQVKGLTPAEVAKTKFYSAKDDDPSFDIEKLYIDGNHILVEFSEEVFYWKNGSAVSLKASDEKPYTISITSTPPAASVEINGAPRGVTPISYKQSSKAEIVVEMMKEGYYPQQYVAFGNGSDLKLNANLIRSIPLDDPSHDLDVQVNQMKMGATQENIDGLKAEFARAKSKVENSYESAKSHVESQFPATPSRMANESDVGYSNRTERWSGKKAEYLTTLTAEKEAILSRLSASEARLASVSVKSSSVAEVAPVEEEPAYEAPVEEEPSIAEASEEVYEDSFDSYEGPEISDRFSSSDEYIKWTGYALIVGGVSALIPATIQYLNFQKADDSYSSTQQNVAQRYANGEISDEQRAYYNEKILPSIGSARDTYKSESFLWGGIGLGALGVGATLLIAF